jgi:hypothetical protein
VAIEVNRRYRVLLASALVRVLVSIVSIRNQPTHAVRVTVTETYFASCKANFRSSIVTF